MQMQLSNLLEDIVEVGEVCECQRVYLSSNDRTRLASRCTMHTAYKGSKAGGPVAQSGSSKLIQLLESL